MNVLTNPIFWLIIGAIIIVMALIGYLAEGTELAKKATKKTEKEDKKTSKAVPEVIPEPVTLNSLVQNSENNLTENNSITNVNEQNAPSAWSGEIQKEDEKKETNYVVPAADDWTVMPTTEQLPQVNLEDNKPEETTNTLSDTKEESVVENSDTKEEISDNKEAEQPEEVIAPHPLLPHEEILTPIEQPEEKPENIESVWE